MGVKEVGTDRRLACLWGSILGLCATWTPPHRGPCRAWASPASLCGTLSTVPGTIPPETLDCVRPSIVIGAPMFMFMGTIMGNMLDGLGMPPSPNIGINGMATMPWLLHCGPALWWELIWREGYWKMGGGGFRCWTPGYQNGGEHHLNIPLSSIPPPFPTSVVGIGVVALLLHPKKSIYIIRYNH